MLLLYSVGDMLDHTLDLLRINTGQRAYDSPFSSAKLVKALNSAYFTMTADGLKNTRHELLRYVNTTVADTTSGALSIRWTPRSGRIVWALPMESESDTVPDLQERNLVIQRMRNNLAYTKRDWYLRTSDNAILVNPAAGTNWRVWYLGEAAPLHEATASAGSSSSITMPATATLGQVYPLNDLYNNSRIYISSGTGAGQFARITDFVGSTRVATLGAEASYSGTPLDPAADSTSVYSVLPWFSETFYDYLCLLTAMQFQNVPAAQELGSRLVTHEAAWRSYIEDQDENRREFVRDTGSVDSGLEGDGYGNGRLNPPDGEVWGY